MNNKSPGTCLDANKAYTLTYTYFQSLFLAIIYLNLRILSLLFSKLTTILNKMTVLLQHLSFEQFLACTVLVMHMNVF